MKLITFNVDGCEKVGALKGDYIIDLREAYSLQLLSKGFSIDEAVQRACKEIPDCMLSFIECGKETLEIARESIEFIIKNNNFGKATYLLKDVNLLTPILKPPMILNMGNAYRPSPLSGFTFKPVTAIIGPDEPIVIPKEISDFGAVWEIEIGIIIGKKGRRIPNNKTAYDYVFSNQNVDIFIHLDKTLNVPALDFTGCRIDDSVIFFRLLGRQADQFRHIVIAANHPIKGDNIRQRKISSNVDEISRKDTYSFRITHTGSLPFTCLSEG